MSPTADDGAVIITFPRAWTAAQRLAFMEDVARAVPRERWAHVGELMGTEQHRRVGHGAPGGPRAGGGAGRAAGGWGGCGARARVDGMNAEPPLEHDALTPVS